MVAFASMRVAVAQIAPKLGDPDANLSIHLKAIDRARRARADLVVFPELSLTGYLLQDLVPDVAEEASSGRRLRAIAGAAKGASVVAGFVERAPGQRYYNAAACFVRGSLAHVHRKVYLPTYGMFDEGRYFGAGEGFRTFEAPWGRSGVLVCEDFWHLSSSYLLAIQGLDVLIVISASPVKGLDGSRQLRSRATWADLGRVVARHLTCWVVYANRAGYEEGWAFQGGSYVCAPSGDVVAEGAILKEDLLLADLPAAALRKARLTNPLQRDERLDLVRRELERAASERETQEAIGRRAGGEPR